MAIVNEIISNYLDEIEGRYRANDHSDTLRNQFRGVWDDYIANSNIITRELNLTNQIFNFEEVWIELSRVFDIVQIMELNYSSEDRLDYSTGEEIKVIAIGGNQLSRGLTLEGLMISYYLRASQQYDTLLQMARWFGYRRGYEDLTRVHTTQLIWGYFEHLSLVEEELRSEIYRYEEERMTPLQMALAIRAHRNLNVTARNKMGAGRARQISYSGSLNQTIWFSLDQPEILRANLNLGESFIRTLNDRVGFTNINNGGVHLANQRIDGATILEEFLNRYNFVDKEQTGGPGLDAENLLSYIFRRINHTNPELTNWSVAVVGNVNPTRNNTTLDYGGLQINRIQRSRKHTANGYNIGVLTEPAHLRIDLHDGDERSPDNPLLLLYLLWRDSRAGSQLENPTFDQRIDLFRFLDTERIDVLGIAIVFPSSQYEPNNYIGQ